MKNMILFISTAIIVVDVAAVAYGIHVGVDINIIGWVLFIVGLSCRVGIVAVLLCMIVVLCQLWRELGARGRPHS